MSACLAVLQDTFAYRRCSNYARTGGCLTCISHKNYSFKDKIFIDKPSPLRFLHIRSAGVKENIEEWIRLGLLDITPETIGALRGKERWAYFWMLCAKHTIIRPEWNPDLYRRIVGQLFSWWSAVALGPVTIRNSDILRLICVKGSCSLFYEGLFMFPKELMNPDTENVFFWLFYDAAKLHPEWFLEFWMTAVPESQSDLLAKSSHPVARILEGARMAEWLRAQKEAFYGRRPVFAEELLAVAHHPSRFLEWTLDWRERAEVEGRWDIRGWHWVPLRDVIAGV